MVGLSLSGSIVIGVPLGIWASRPGWMSEIILGITGVIQTIPSLALLALLVSIHAFGIGPQTAIAALLALWAAAYCSQYRIGPAGYSSPHT